MAITLNGTTGITTPDLTSADDITANGSTVLTAATSPAALPLAGGTLTGNVNLGNNVKANFGAGSDLQIYYDGANSLIVNNTNSLVIQNHSDDKQVIIQSDNGGGGLGDYFRADGATGETILYYYGTAKIATSATGVTVTGNVDTSGTILVGGTNSVFAENNLRFNSGGASYIDHTTVGQAINFRVSNASSVDTTAMTISSTGVISGNGSGLTGVGGSTDYGAVGTYAFLYRQYGIQEDLTYAGSSLVPAALYATSTSGTDYFEPGYITKGGSALSGTWRSMGRSMSDPSGPHSRTTVFVRIS